jgi:hypothetical protein
MKGEQEKLEGRVDMIKAQYMHVWRCHSETQLFVQFICINNYNF